MGDEILGDYKILKTIGRGSLGTAVLAEHRFIKRPYVLKLLPAELSSNRNFITRFEEEAALLASLDHPHIVKIHNVSYANGVYFLVTDCVVDALGETTNLAQYMSGRQERFREEELFLLLAQIADALDYAHFKNGESEPLLMRSLKLNNILVGKGKPGIEVALSDFGLAKIIGSAAVVGRSFKALAESLGAPPKEGIEESENTPYLSVPIEPAKVSKLTLSFLQNYAFLAPEQKRGQQERIETDNYAFGVLAYYLIAGEFPEGVFPDVKEIAPEYQYNWDMLIKACLQKNWQKRPKKLLPILEEIKSGVKESFAPIKQFSPPPVMTPPPLRHIEEAIEKKEVPTPFFLRKEAEKMVEQRIEEPVLVGAKMEAIAPAPVLAPAPAPVFTPPPAPASPLPHVHKEEGYQKQLAQMLNREPIVTEYHPEEKEKREITPLLTEMIAIQGGTYERGCNEGARDEMPKHKITIDTFAIDIHPVTNEQYVRFLDYIGAEKDAQNYDLIRLKESRIKRTAGKLSIESGYSKHPVVGVTWYGAIGYARWVKKRLPTEAEWEIACRGGMDGQIYPTGDSIEKSEANFFSSDTTPVMSYAANGYGLFDMVGNVYEWCQDWYDYNYYETSALEPRNPKGPIQGVYRVLRGGCWKSLKEDLRSSHRHRNNPGTMNGTYGFRCASDIL